MKWLARACLLLAATTDFCLASEDDASPATIDELIVAIETVMEEKDVPSVGLSLVAADGPYWTGALGLTDRESGREASADSMYRIGSVSKMFVSLAVLLLVEEGRLSLDAKLADLAPEIEYENPWADTHPIRVVHLLEHTTGWDDLHLPEYAHNVTPPVSLREGLAFHPHSRTSRWAPGTRMSYCNSGPPVAAYLVEKITGQDFEKYVKENFFDVLGMTSATYLVNADYREHGVTLYTAEGQPADYWHIIMRPSGAINASPRDMARLVEFYLNRGVIDGERLLGEASLERMETVGSTTAARAGQTGGYGLSNYSSRHEAWTYREHNGGVIGGITELAYLPDAGLGHAIMLSNDDGSALREISRLVRDFETRNLDAPPKPAAIDITDAHLSVAGFYVPINPRQEASRFLDRVFDVHRLSIEDGQLAHRGLFGDEATYFFPVTDALYARAESGLIEAASVIDPVAGPVLSIGNRVLKPVAPAIVYLQLLVALLWALAIVSSVIYFLVWGVSKLRGRLGKGATIRVRVWPLVASLAVLAFVGFFMAGVTDPFARLGVVSVFSLGLFLASIVFAVAAVLGVVAVVRSRSEPMNRANYWHSAAASLTHLVVAVYLAAFGVIGITTWT